MPNFIGVLVHNVTAKVVRTAFGQNVAEEMDLTLHNHGLSYDLSLKQDVKTWYHLRVQQYCMQS